MRLRAHSSRVTTRRSTVAIAGVLALAILAALPRPLKRQDVARQLPASPSAAEESGISEPVGMPKSGDWLAPADIPKSRPQIPRGHQAASKGRDDHLTVPAIRHDPSAVSEEAQIVGDSAVSAGGLSRSGVLTSHNLESDLGGEARGEEGQVSIPVVSGEPQVTMRTPLLTPPVLLWVGSRLYPAEGYRIVVDHSAYTPGIEIDAAEGRVVLKILVRADGSVGGVEVAQSSGRSVLDATAVREVSPWKFTPATRDGQPIDAWALVPLLFVLR
jgi:TonB family protein